MLFRTSSSIRTLTVGPGISPDLLTFACRRMRSARGLADRIDARSAYRRWGIPPRPEDVLNRQDCRQATSYRNPLQCIDPTDGSGKALEAMSSLLGARQHGVQ